MPSVAGHVFLIGFMGSGKSTVGRVLAEMLGRPFIDIDEFVEESEGATVAELFAHRGEQWFRDAETRALASVACAPPAVVACGGGIVLREENRQLLAREGVTVLLEVSAEEALRRVGGDPARPLLDGDPAAVAGMLAGRSPLYSAAADISVSVDALSAEEVGARVREALESAGERHVAVSAPGGRYEVMVAEGLLGEAGRRLRPLFSGGRAFVVTDDVVGPLYAQALEAALAAEGIDVSTATVAAGEASKTWLSAGRLLDEIAAAGLERTDLVVALGGGVVGDLAGFCAGTYMRGIAFAQLPTTLLAQVDSAIGGKTGVDLAAGKNLAGVFWQPVAVLADTAALRTLPLPEWRNGLAEVSKAAFLAGGENLAWLEAHAGGLASPSSQEARRMVTDAAAFKAGVVSADEREAGLRECLNYGHTLGHAIEKVAGYGKVPHGAAVAEGMRFAAVLAQDVLGAPSEWTERQGWLLDAFGLNLAVERPDPAALRAAMSADKKARGGRVRFVLSAGPGQWRAVAVEEDTLEGHLRRWAEGETRG